MTWFTPKWIPSGTPSERRRRRVVEMDDRFSPGRWRLYAITDERIAGGRSHLQVAEAVLRGGADVLQLRDKEAGGGKLYRVALQLRKLTREAKIPLIVNDRLDIALAVDADGVHVGPEDLPVSVARRILGPGKILGVSTETVEEALLAEKEGADYLGVGPVFEARGTNAENAREVREAGADAAAVISAIVAADDIEQAARRLKRILSGAEEGR